MKTYFFDHPITYDGTQLRPHWILEKTKITGDCLISFHGPAHVKTESLIDIHDRQANAIIYSESMIHFIGEWFRTDIQEMVFRQRLFIATLGEIIGEKSNAQIKRIGDDLFIKDRKLSVSIATVSLVSGLLHIGINISSRNTPVPAIGLDDLKICPFEITHQFLKIAEQEEEGIKIACAKVSPA